MRAGRLEKPPGVRKPAGLIPSRVLIARFVSRTLSRITSAGVRPAISQGLRSKAELDVLRLASPVR